MSKLSRLALLACAACTPACTWGEGGGFATLEEVELKAHIEPSAFHELGPGNWRTDLGYRVQLASAELHFEELVLQQGVDDTSSGFDPSNPPPGYSLCHAGHCHSDDGRLVEYAEIERELASSGSAYAAVVRVPVAGAADLIAGGVLLGSDVLPSRELPSVVIERVLLRARSFSLRGTVHEGPAQVELPEAGLPLAIDFELSAPFQGRAQLGIDRDSPDSIEVDVELIVSSTLLDGRVDWVDPQAPQSEPVLDGLAQSELRLHSH